MADTKTLDEHAETVKRLDAADARLAEVFGPRPESVRAVRDAYEAERAARVSAQAGLAGWEAEAQTAMNQRDAAYARVRELEAERSAWASSSGRWAGEATAQEDARHVAEAGLSVSETVRRHDEATLAETRAQLARLREAAEVFLAWGRRVDLDGASFHGAALEAALSTPGPTLAEIRRAAQVEVLREMSGRVALLGAEWAGLAPDEQPALDYEDGCHEAACRIRQHADDLAMNAAERRVLRAEKAAKGGDRG